MQLIKIVKIDAIWYYCQKCVKESSEQNKRIILFAQEAKDDLNHPEHMAGEGYGGGVSAETERRRAPKYMNRETLREAAFSNKGNFEPYVNRDGKKKLRLFVAACCAKIGGKQKGQKEE